MSRDYATLTNAQLAREEDRIVRRLGQLNRRVVDAGYGHYRHSEVMLEASREGAPKLLRDYAEANAEHSSLLAEVRARTGGEQVSVSLLAYQSPRYRRLKKN